MFITQKWGINRLKFVVSLVNLTHKVADIATKNINHTQFFFNLFAFSVFLLALNKLIKYYKGTRRQIHTLPSIFKLLFVFIIYGFFATFC